MLKSGKCALLELLVRLFGKHERSRASESSTSPLADSKGFGRNVAPRLELEFFAPRFDDFDASQRCKGTTASGNSSSYNDVPSSILVSFFQECGGNVGKWLRANGDPRTGQIEWVDWIERIPIAETRSYVEHVLENAVVYDSMNPDKASYGGPNPLSHFLGKSTPG